MSTSTHHTESPPVSFSTHAFREIKHIIRTKNIPDSYGLRVGVKGGGCSGLSFMLGFDGQSDTDKVFMVDGVRILIEKKHMMYLIGKTIEYREGETAMGFVFADGGKQEG